MTHEEILALAKKFKGQKSPRQKHGIIHAGEKVMSLRFRERTDQNLFIAALPDENFVNCGPCDDQEYAWVYVRETPGKKGEENYMSDSTALYNTDMTLWDIYAQTGDKVRLQDGMLQRMNGSDKGSWVARFRDDDMAADTLTRAGWQRNGQVWTKK